MNKRNSQNERLDRIGCNLLEAARMRNSEIEKIVCAPQLFDSIKARVKAEQNMTAKKSFFGKRRHFSFWSWQRISAFSALLFLVVNVVGFVLFGKLGQRIEMVDVREVESNIESFETKQKPQTPSDLPKPVRTKVHRAKSQTIAKEFARKSEKPETRNTLQTIKFVNLPKIAKTERNSEFYALAYAGNPVEKGEVLQVVRAELSPSSLFALGVDIPIENAPEKIKTDLLVGSDGVARAIRFVE